MIEKVKSYFQDENNEIQVFLKWITLGSFVGVIVGIIANLFHGTLEWATEFHGQNPWLIWLLPVGGVFIAWLYKHWGMEKDKGTNFILIAVRSNEQVALRTTPLIFISTVVTHLFGGSSGREGAALQLGGSIASRLGGAFRLNEKDNHVITMCGMSAGFAALFGTPLAAVVFSMEVITVGIMHYSAIVPCLIAALIATSMASSLGFHPTAFVITNAIVEIEFISVLRVGLLGVLCALVSILFCIVIEKTIHYYKHYMKDLRLRACMGGVLVIILTYTVGSRDYNGAGMDIIHRAVAGEARPEAFLLKMVFTALTLGAGYKGGEIVPSLFIGATFGCVIAPLIGLPPSFAAGLGMTAVFCGVTNCPMASLILGIELFGIEGLVYYALCCGISYMLSGYYGLYTAQKIMYSKLQTKFIDKNVV